MFGAMIGGLVEFAATVVVVDSAADGIAGVASAQAAAEVGKNCRIENKTIAERSCAVNNPDDQTI